MPLQIIKEEVYHKERMVKSKYFFVHFSSSAFLFDEGWKEKDRTSVDTSLIACEDVYLPSCCAMSADIVLMSPPPPSTRVTTDSVT